MDNEEARRFANTLQAEGDGREKEYSKVGVAFARARFLLSTFKAQNLGVEIGALSFSCQTIKCFKIYSSDYFDNQVPNRN